MVKLGNNSSRLFRHFHNSFLIEQNPNQATPNSLRPNLNNINYPNSNSVSSNWTNPNPYNPNQIASNSSLDGVINLLKLFIPNSGLSNLLQGLLKGQPNKEAPSARIPTNFGGGSENRVSKNDSESGLSKAKRYYLNMINNGLTEEKLEVPGKEDQNFTSEKKMREEIKKLNEENKELRQQLDRIKGIIK